MQGEPGKKEARCRASRLIQMVGLAGFEHRFPAELSGGMRQRVNLARALATDPSLLLMDEPFGALDAQTRELMQTELLNIWEGHRKTVMFVTHDIQEAIFLADRVVVLTARPARVREIVEVRIPRPRPAQIKRQPQFAQLEGFLWELLQQERQRN
jgi:NitT/TauT family transport system ATP-binding protein